MKVQLCALASVALVASADRAAAQYTIPLHPFSQTGDLFVSCPSNDAIYRLQDLDLDGRYDSPGETILFYSDELGPVPLTNPNGITVGINGVVYVSDSSEEFILRLIDLDGDGSCHGPGEATIYYQGGPGAPVTMASPQNLTVDLFGNVYVSVAGDGAENQDRIVILTDANFDGAIAANEVKVVYEFPTGAVGTNIPQDVQVGPDLRVYFVENGTGVPKGVYRMDDANIDGVYDATEVTPFFLVPAGSATPFFWGMTIDAEGFFYLPDTGNDVIWRFRDENADNVIDPVTEASIWWTSPGSSLIWRLAAASDGSIYAAESQAPDRIVRLFDANDDGVIDDATETLAVWSDLVSAIDIVNPRSLAFDRNPTVETQAAVSVSSPLGVQTYGTIDDLVVLYWSAATINPIPVAPFGFVGIDPSPGVSGFLSSGAIPVFGPMSVVVPALLDPALVGFTVHFQALVGKASRLRFSNVASTTFAP